jgi:hypothetical protein
MSATPALTASKVSTFDHLVSAGEQRRRHVKAEYPGGLVVDDQLELGRLHDRQVRGPGAFEDASGIDTGLTPRTAMLAP